MHAWSRTYRSQAVTFANGPIESRGGMRVIPDRRIDIWSSDGTLVLTIGNRRPAETLAAITERYGSMTAHVVAMQLEYLMDDGTP